MGRRSDPLRVTRAQMEGARMRLADLATRRDLTEDQRARHLAEAEARLAELEVELAALEAQRRR